MSSCLHLLFFFIFKASAQIFADVVETGEFRGCSWHGILVDAKLPLFMRFPFV